MIVPVQKRSSNSEIDESDGRADGVGGRQQEADAAGGGGGYQDICTAEDPRLEDLRAVGLADHWLDVAEAIGVDNFLAAWKILSSSESVVDDAGRVYLPSMATYNRIRRNKFIMTLAESGMSPSEIQTELSSQLGYILTAGHIRHIVNQSSK